jgi:hypothetical protein
MSFTEAERVFRPRPSITETKAHNTTMAVRAILDDEVAARERKTARLQIARLEREAADAASLTPPPPAKPGRRRTAKKS